MNTIRQNQINKKEESSGMRCSFCGEVPSRNDLKGTMMRFPVCKKCYDTKFENEEQYYAYQKLMYHDARNVEKVDKKEITLLDVIVFNALLVIGIIGIALLIRYLW